jgi:hypothetical protein
MISQVAADEGFDPQREFIREMTLRIERASRAVVRELAGLGGAVAAMQGDLRQMGVGIREVLVGQATLRDESRAMQDEIRDLRDKTRAQTRALLRVIDRLEGGGASAA